MKYAAILLVACLSPSAVVAQNWPARNIGHEWKGPVSTYTAHYHTEHLKDTIVKSWDNVFPEDLFKDLQKDCAKLGSHSTETKSFMHGKKMTYFMRTNAQGNKREGKPLSSMEYAIELLARVDFNDEDRKLIVGAEYWVQSQSAGKAGDIGFHYDKDEAMASEQGKLKCPTEGTITYLGDNGAPTMIVNRTTPNGNDDDPFVPLNAAVSYPVPNRHLIFRGNLAHGVPGMLSRHTKGKRLTFLVNWWQYQPVEPNCVEMKPSLAKQLGYSGAKYEPLRADPQARSLNPKMADAPPTVVTPAAGSAMGEGTRMHHVKLSAPDEQMYFGIPKDGLPADLNLVHWDRSNVFAQLVHLDLDDERAMDRLWKLRVPAVMVFVPGGTTGGSDTKVEGAIGEGRQMLADVVLPVQTKFFEKAQFYIADSGADSAHADAMESFPGLEPGPGVTAVAVHNTQSDEKWVFKGEMTQEALGEFLGAVFAGEVAPDPEPEDL